MRIVWEVVNFSNTDDVATMLDTCSKELLLIIITTKMTSSWRLSCDMLI